MDPFISTHLFDSLHVSATVVRFFSFFRFEFLRIHSFRLFLSFASFFTLIPIEFVAKQSCESWNSWNAISFSSQFRGFVCLFAYLSLIPLLFVLFSYLLLTPSSISTVSLFLIDLFLLLLLFPTLLHSLSRLFPLFSLLSSSLSFPLYLLLFDFLPFPAILILSGTLKTMKLLSHVQQVAFLLVKLGLDSFIDAKRPFRGANRGSIHGNSRFAEYEAPEIGLFSTVSSVDSIGMDFDEKPGDFWNHRNTIPRLFVWEIETVDVLLIRLVFWDSTIQYGRKRGRKKQPICGSVAGVKTAGIEKGKEVEWRDDRIDSSNCVGSNSMASKSNTSGASNCVFGCVPCIRILSNFTAF